MYWKICSTMNIASMNLLDQLKIISTLVSEKTGFDCICRLIYMFLKFVFQALFYWTFKVSYFNDETFCRKSC